MTQNLKSNKTRAFHYPFKAMGCGFVISAVHHDAQTAWDGIRAGVQEINRVEKLISSWDEKSETHQINTQSGISAVIVSEELFDLIDRSIKISKLTNGAFDISGNLSRFYWNFNKEENAVLSDDKIEELKNLIDYDSIKLNQRNSSVYLSKKGMSIGFGGIGKGYAADRVKKLMQNMGIESGLINASGDVVCFGEALKQEHWGVKIPHPKNRDQALHDIKIPYGSVVTSGTHENYTLIDGKKYSHIVSPKTGMPVTHTKNVSVISVSAEFADAMATAFSVLPTEESLGLANKLNGLECIITSEDDEVHYSQNLKSFIYD